MSAPLDYAPKPRRRRALLRRLTALLLLLTLLYTTRRVGPPAWQRIQFYRAQQQCLNHTAPADEVVFDSTAAPRDAATYAFHHLLSPDSAAPTMLTSPFRPQPPALAALRRYFPAAPPDLLDAPAFLGERVSPGGPRRLVVVSPLCVHLFGAAVTFEPVAIWS